VFVDVIPVSAVLYIINFANCYQNDPQKTRKEAKEGREGKLRMLCNPFFIMKKLGKGSAFFLKQMFRGTLSFTQENHHFIV
jgi:hypothetical protein